MVGIGAVSLLRAERRGSRRDELRRLAMRSVREIKTRKRGRYAELARPIEAALAIERRDHAEAVRLLRAPAITHPLYGAHESARKLALGELLGGDEGKALVQEARASLRAQGVKNVDAFMRTLLGFCRPDYADT